jgi:glycosyltransferase involved in cell wall biosynthesis
VIGAVRTHRGRIAFYATLKPPMAPSPSGDRAMARLLIAGLAAAGYRVELAARLRAGAPGGDAARQARIAAAGARLADHLIRRYRADPAAAPDLWFAYHLYDKAPDWIGPAVATALDIPYVVAEASVAPSRASGPWAIGHAATVAALGRADLVLGLNSADRAGVAPHLVSYVRWCPLKPFIETAPFAAASRARADHRARLAHEHGLDSAVPWLIAVAMMRPGDKLASYRQLADALGRIVDRPWRLLLIGDGAARDRVAAAFAGLTHRVALLGRRDPAEIAGLLAAADLCVWPAVREAYGMALLEAQAAGLPVVAGHWGGVPDIVADDIAGTLVPRDDMAAFAAAVARYLDDPELRAQAGTAAQRIACADHDFQAAAIAIALALDRVRR